jgi:putative membrane protein
MFRRFRLIRSTTFFALAALALVVVSCAKKESSETATATSDTAAAPAAPALTDGNIVAIFVAANDADIKNGQQAKGKSKNKQVKDFADRMIQDHTAAKKEATDLAGRANITSEDNDASKQLVSDTDAMRDSLGKMTGTAYDKNYIDDEVAIHEKVLSTLDNTLIPNAQNPDLKALLTHARDIVNSHLEHAKSIQTQMASK